MAFLLYYFPAVLSGASLSQKMLLCRRQLNVARERLPPSPGHSMRQCYCIKAIGFISLATQIIDEKPAGGLLTGIRSNQRYQLVWLRHLL